LSTTPLTGVKSEKELFKSRSNYFGRGRYNNSPYGGVKVTKGYFGGGRYCNIWVVVLFYYFAYNSQPSPKSEILTLP